MISKSDIQSFYDEYSLRIEELYHHYNDTVDDQEKQNLFHQLEGMIYILSMFRERFDLVPVSVPESKNQI